MNLPIGLFIIKTKAIFISVPLILFVHRNQLSFICPFMVGEETFSFSLLAVGLSSFLSYDGSHRVYAF
jgi:hypothetical protein